MQPVSEHAIALMHWPSRPTAHALDRNGDLENLATGGQTIDALRLDSLLDTRRRRVAAEESTCTREKSGIEVGIRR